jgi:hypothetical protein
MASSSLFSSARTFCIGVARRVLPGPVMTRVRSLAVRRLKGDAKDVFTQIHDKNIWGYEESVSGAGSTLRYTETIRQTLPGLLKELGVESMLDLPCGDFNWMRQVELPVSRYIGGDIVEGLIAKNQAQYGRGGERSREFRVLDLSKDDLPAVDVLFCRDCLMHLNEDLVFACLRNMARSPVKYVLTTTYAGGAGVRNRVIRTGDWFPINLCAEPYGLPEPMRKLEDWMPPFDRRVLGLWKVGDLRAWAEGHGASE